MQNYGYVQRAVHQIFAEQSKHDISADDVCSSTTFRGPLGMDTVGDEESLRYALEDKFGIPMDQILSQSTNIGQVTRFIHDRQPY